MAKEKHMPEPEKAPLRKLRTPAEIETKIKHLGTNPAVIKLNPQNPDFVGAIWLMLQAAQGFSRVKIHAELRELRNLAIGTVPQENTALQGQIVALLWILGHDFERIRDPAPE